jgi:uncharacterized protein (UPF0332 family)
MTPEQAALLHKARASLEAADLLADRGFQEFAVSRAYYAMFYVVEALLLEEGLAFSKHSAVIAAFGKRFTKTGRVPPEYHRYLIEAQDRRNIGDYDIGPQVSKLETAEQIVRARRFLELSERLIGPVSGARQA